MRDADLAANDLGTARAFDDIEDKFNAVLDSSLEPKGPDALFDLVADLHLRAGAVVVDVGCGRGSQAVTLAQRFGFRVLGIDPAPRFNAELVGPAGSASGSVRFEVGRAEDIPAADGSIDLLWCRESLGFADLDAAGREFRRVLRPGGYVLVFQVFMGPRISENEADELSRLLRGHSVWPDDVERALVDAGFSVRTRVDYRSEMGELAQETAGVGGQRLLRAARLLREPERYIQQFGRENYEIMLGDCLWHVYRMIGKMVSYAFVFKAPDGVV